MSSVVISGDSSGAITLAAPAAAGANTLTLPAATDTLVGKATTDTLTNKTLSTGLVMAASAITSGVAQASTSGTNVDFTGIPSWVKRVTVMFNGVSTNGSSAVQVQIGSSSGGIETSGYSGGSFQVAASTAGYNSYTSGFVISLNDAATSARNGSIILTNLSGNIWTAIGCISDTGGGRGSVVEYVKSISSTLDRVRITTVNGSDTFDAGSINIMYE